MINLRNLISRVLLSVVLLGGWSVVQANSAPAINGTFGGDFTLQSTVGESLSLKQLSGKVVLLNFGYTSCPDVCPVVLSQLSALLKRLDVGTDKLQPLFVSFDIKRDNLSQLERYLSFFHPGIIGLTGSFKEVDEVAARYGVLYMKQQVDSPLEYTYSHSDYVYLIDQQGRLRTFYSSDESYRQLEADIRYLLDN